MVNTEFNKRYILYAIISEGGVLVDINSYPFDNEYNSFCKKSVIIPISKIKTNTPLNKIYVNEDGVIYE